MEYVWMYASKFYRNFSTFGPSEKSWSSNARVSNESFCSVALQDCWQLPLTHVPDFLTESYVLTDLDAEFTWFWVNVYSRRKNTYMKIVHVNRYPSSEKFE